MQLPIPYGKHEISDEDINAVIEVLRSDYLTQGPKVGEFETAFASYVNARYAVAVVNGTTALHLACLAIDIKKGDRVLTTPMTFAATANCVLYCGGEIQFVDINNETFLLDFGKLEDTLKSKPQGYYKGVISVDYGGLSSDLEQLKEIAKEHGLWIISTEFSIKIPKFCEYFLPIGHISANRKLPPWKFFWGIPQIKSGN